MRCLLCPADGNITWRDLVAIQAHVMHEYGYSRFDLRKNTRRPVSRTKDHFIWPHRAGIALRGGAGLGLRLAKTISFWRSLAISWKSF